VVLWVVLMAAALWGVRRRAIWSFGLLWYLVGHSLESSLVALELVFEHRNYLPSFGILFAAAYYLVWGIERLAGTRRLGYPVAGLLVVVIAFVTFTRAGNWGDRLTIVEFSLLNHPLSSRTHGEYATTNAKRSGDIELAYRHWARAAELNPSSVLELIEMERVLAAQILAFEAQDGGGSGATASYPPATRFSAPMQPDLDYLKALHLLVAAEIDRRLQTRPIIMGNVAALRTLERCIRSKLPPCTALYPNAVQWFQRAIENRRVNDRARAVLQLGLARLYALGGDVEKAIATAEAAARTNPGEIQYLFELAALYLTLNDLDAAESMIATAESRMSYSGFRHGVLRDLKDQLEKARVHENPTTTFAN
jgi:tetratricopeptide (TPR) repeat protein